MRGQLFSVHLVFVVAFEEPTGTVLASNHCSAMLLATAATFWLVALLLWLQKQIENSPDVIDSQTASPAEAERGCLLTWWRGWVSDVCM
ncbi:hypothetical protein BX600DRAFT_458389, partial [Xylariales sp. PMI_506]